MRSPIPLRFRLYRPPPRAVYDATDGEYVEGASTYAVYNYLGGGPVAHIKSAHFEAALRQHEGRPFDLARTELVYGEALRRARRRGEARAHLRNAQETFRRLGATPWADRAGVELRATGETARKRDPSTLIQLTPQELQIVSLVSEGGTNREIGAQLFLSRRTIDYHLRNVFVKLGVSSRAELIRLQLDR